MKNRALIFGAAGLLIAIIIFFLLNKTEHDSWYPFVLPEKLDNNSPANIGKLVLDPPAGKHGFVKVKDSHFYFEDGTHAKFWGTNLCFNACFPTKKQAELIADRLAFFGFNAVRLHHMDFYFEPKGIFKDVCPDYTDPQIKKTGVLSNAQLDRLDYLIYQLKLRGIYVDMNLLVSRHFTKADGVIDADKLDMAAKPASLFDPKLIELQKRYAKELLTHLNPYTNLRYCNDPVIALVEITNENSISDSNLKKLPEYYRDEVENLYANWTKENGRLKNKRDFYTSIEKKYIKEMVEFLKKEIGVKVPITGSQYLHPEAQEACDFVDKHMYWDHPKFPRKSWDKNDFTIHNRSLLLFKNFSKVGKIFTKDPDINKPRTMTEWNHCYPNKYAYEGPVFVASEAKKNDWEALFQFTFSDGWDPPLSFDSIRNHFDALANPQQLILMSIGSLIFDTTSDLNMAMKNGVLSLTSPYINGSVGFIGRKQMRFDNITIKTRQNGAVFLAAVDGKPLKSSENIFLFTLSEVKNTNSGWGARFRWGNPPTLLKRIGADFELSSDKTFKIYELDENGRRKTEIKSSTKNGIIKFSTQGINSPWVELVAV